MLPMLLLLYVPFFYSFLKSPKKNIAIVLLVILEWTCNCISKPYILVSYIVPQSYILFGQACSCWLLDPSKVILLLLKISYFAMALCTDLSAFYSRRRMVQLYLDSFSLQKIAKVTSKSFNNQHLDDLLVYCESSTNMSNL